MRKVRVLVVDDELGMLEVCRDTLRPLGDLEVATETEGAAAASRLGEGWDLLITDIRMPGVSGIDLLAKAREADPDLPVLMLTAYPTLQTAVECLKLGAADYITKPFLPDELLSTVRRILETCRLDQENRLLRRHLARSYAFGEMVGRSAAMRSVFEAVERIAGTDLDVLVIGETGTGKELVARNIHQRSKRVEGEFVPVDCGAIPEDLLESEFFGHERGAFTGATERRLGLMEFASGGTLFLDEVNHLPLHLQAKLLRVLQERRIRRVGGTREIDVDVRIIAASSVPLAGLAEDGRFRAELLYRINVARVELPPLRDRPDDTPLLVSHFLAKVGAEMELPPIDVDPDALEVLTAYPWPGNVRELQNVIKRILAIARPRVIRIDHIPDEIVSGAGEVAALESRGFFMLRDRHTAAFERNYLENLLKEHDGDVSAAAEAAKVPRGTLYRLLNKHAIVPAFFR